MDEQILLELSVIERTPRPTALYTQLLWCFSAPEDSEQEKLVATLTKGLVTLTAALPWVAGQVVNDGNALKVVSHAKIPKLSVKDFNNDGTMSTMEGLRDVHFTSDMLDESNICPRSTMSKAPLPNDDDPHPVMLLQANFCKGGLLLVIQVAHAVMDIMGQTQVARLFSQACRGEKISEGDILSANLNRETLLVDFLGTHNLTDVRHVNEQPAQKTEKDEINVRMASPRKSAADVDVPLTWGSFSFGSKALSYLKTSITSQLPGNSAYVSTDDCISAALWQALGQARLKRADPSSELSFVRLADMRKHTGISEGYTGNLVTSTTATTTLERLSKRNLSSIAAELRAALDPALLRRSLIAQISPERQAANRNGTAQDRVNTLKMSSWSKADCYNLDFGLDLGRPEAVRRPIFSPVEGIVYLLPKAPDGDIIASFCLREDDMLELTQNRDFREYADFIG